MEGIRMIGYQVLIWVLEVWQLNDETMLFDEQLQHQHQYPNKQTGLWSSLSPSNRCTIDRDRRRPFLPQASRTLIHRTTSRSLQRTLPLLFLGPSRK